MQRGLIVAILCAGVTGVALAKPVKKRPASSGAAAAAAAATPAAVGMNGAFYLDKLPNGKSVTIPRPATTIVPLTLSATLTGTDIPQSLSFRAVTSGGGAYGGPKAIRISIFDRNSERVRYVDLKPGMPYVYAMKDLETITVVPQLSGHEGDARSLALQIESDKPLEIAH